MNRFCHILLLAAAVFVYCGASRAQYSGSQAYNHLQRMHASVNTATGTFHLAYPLLKTTGVHNPFTIKLTYQFNADGMFGFPKGWRLDLDHINGNVAEIGGQWLIDPLWHDETLFASGLKYCNQHGSQFQDKVEEELVPGEDSLYYRYRSQHKDGVFKYFSRQGLLILQEDRFGNKVTFEYEQPVNSIATAKLAAVIDNYGNRYTFRYAPGSLTVHYPDARQQTVYFNQKGVTTIVNPLKQRFDIKYTNHNGQNLIKTIASPSGLISQLSYSTIPVNTEYGVGTLPVVTAYIQSDAADQKIHNETYYNYTQETNYTGYPSYSMSHSGDGLMDSNDEKYRYKVDVEQIDSSQDTPQIHHTVYYYNYLHLPVEIRTLKDDKDFLKTNYTYEINPFKYSRSTNYDKPASIVHSTWSEKAGEYILSNRVDERYDLFGNKTHESHWVFDRPKNSWLLLKSADHKYYTAYYSLLAESIHKDLVSGTSIKEAYYLSPAKKTHSSKLTYGMKKDKRWQPWQQQFYCHDHLGRVVSGELKWLAKGMPGVQRTHKKTHYHFDKNTGALTTQHVSSLGRVTQTIVDTRNHQVQAKISPKGEKVAFRYNALGQIIERIDEEGHIHKVHHYSYAQDGLNARVIESPLGYKKRYTMDASARPVMGEEWVDGQYRKMGEKTFNAFGKVIISKDKLGNITTYQYDDQMRLIEQVDPWLNKQQFVYDDEKLTSYTLINGKKNQQEEQTPWSLTTKKTYFPLSKAKLNAVEVSTKKDAFGRILSKESVLLDTQPKARHSAIRNSYEYDIGHNRIKVVTQGYGGLSLTKTIKYDLFKNQYSTVKTQDDNGRLNIHRGYTYVYNTDNKLERVISPEFDNGQRFVTKHRYDKNGREVEREFADGHIIRHQYTPKGFLKSSCWNRHDKVFQVSHEHNADGLLTKATDSDGQELHYQYDLKGNLTRRIYPDKQQQDYEYDQYNRLVRQKNVGNRVLTYHYDDKDKGLLSAIKSDAHQVRFTYGKSDNGFQGALLAIERDIAGTGKTKEAFTYGPYGRVIASTVTTASAPSKDNVLVESDKSLLSREYEFLPRGELIKQTTRSINADNQPVTNSTCYRYDGLIRLTEEEHRQEENNKPVHAANKEISYQYDGNNNLIKEQRTEGGTTQVIHRHYNEVDQLKTIKKELSGEELTIQHDNNGKIVVDHQGNRYNYDGRGVLLSVSDTQGNCLVRFSYWPDGLLAHTSDGKMSQRFYYHMNGQVQTVGKNKTLHDYVRYGNKFLGTLKGNNGEQLFTSNRSTGARLWVDETGKQAVNVFKYEGYGQTQNPVEEDSGSSTDFLWNQEFRDKKTGLVYLRHRFYHPELRRFIKRDDQKIDNLYAYAAANPIAFVDPLGHNAVSSSLNYGFGVFITALSVTFALFAAPETAGASLTLTPLTAATVTGTAAGAVSGVTTIASQLAFDLGDKKLSSGLRYASYATGVIAGLAGVAALAYSYIADQAAKDATVITDEVSEYYAAEPEDNLMGRSKNRVKKRKKIPPKTKVQDTDEGTGEGVGEASAAAAEEQSREVDNFIVGSRQLFAVNSSGTSVTDLTMHDIAMFQSMGIDATGEALQVSAEIVDNWRYIVAAGGSEPEGDSWLNSLSATPGYTSAMEYVQGFTNNVFSFFARLFGYGDTVSVEGGASLSTSGVASNITTAGRDQSALAPIDPDEGQGSGFWQ